MDFKKEMQNLERKDLWSHAILNPLYQENKAYISIQFVEMVLLHKATSTHVTDLTAGSVSFVQV